MPEVLSGVWPADGATGHLGWSFRGSPQFEARAARFLSEGFARGERLLFVADDPRSRRWPQPMLASGTLVLASVAEVYGAGRLVAPTAQLETFAGACAEAIRDGYSGICVAADNSSLVDGPERLRAWLEWERLADRLMATNPVTGLCAFDQTSLAGDVLAQLMAAHGVEVTSGS